MSCAFKVSGLENQLVKFFSNLCCDAIIYSCVCVCVCVCVFRAHCVWSSICSCLSLRITSLCPVVSTPQTPSLPMQYYRTVLPPALTFLLLMLFRVGVVGGHRGKGEKGPAGGSPQREGAHILPRKGQILWMFCLRCMKHPSHRRSEFYCLLILYPIFLFVYSVPLGWFSIAILCFSGPLSRSLEHAFFSGSWSIPR